VPETATDQPSVIRPPFRADHVGSLLRPPERRESWHMDFIYQLGGVDEAAALIHIDQLCLTALEVWGSL
jgi:hypothetical protein